MVDRRGTHTPAVPVAVPFPVSVELDEDGTVTGAASELWVAAEAMATLVIFATAVGWNPELALDVPLVPLVDETARPTAGAPLCEYE